MEPKNPEAARQQWQAFLQEWPVERLEKLTLDEYYNADNNAGFFQWLQIHTRDIGEFNEGPFNQGIRPRRQHNPDKVFSENIKSDDNYLWYANLGDTAEAAFNTVKRDMLIAAKAAQSGNLASTKSIKLTPGSIIWKVAFLYQDQNKPCILPFYSAKQLQHVFPEGYGTSIIERHQKLLSRKGDRDILEYAAQLVKDADKNPNLDDVFTENDDGELEQMKSPSPLNQILYGPPGTGKTYATIDATLAILAPDHLAEHRNNRPKLKEKFDELANANLVRFVTFHQSFSYEDFVEGLRAETDDTTGQLRYIVANGVFKNLCLVSSTKITQQAQTTIDIKGRTIWKMSLGNTLGADAAIYDECLTGNYILLGYGGNIDFSGCQNREQIHQRYQQAGRTLDEGDYAVTSVDTFVTQMKAGDLVVVSDGNFKFRAIAEITGDYQFKPNASYPGDYAQMRKVKWLRNYEPSLPYDELMNNQFSQMTIYRLRPKAINLDKLAALLSPSSAGKSTGQDSATGSPDTPRVLIIDEINRGNVSRIFGELITLIEPSKRAGAEEALEVVLPYSKERFSVPKNVYLIGTMNTADRSLAGLDIALRRRFVFEEMPPLPGELKNTVIKGINLGDMLEIINQRIEALLDRDHCIGHAYFMPLKNQPDVADRFSGLGSIFRNQIIPLLQEYFFEDWERIQWVLNDHRKPDPADRFIDEHPMNNTALFGDNVSLPPQARRWRINAVAFTRPEAYLGILKTTPTLEPDAP